MTPAQRRHLRRLRRRPDVRIEIRSTRGVSLLHARVAMLGQEWPRGSAYPTGYAGVVARHVRLPRGSSYQNPHGDGEAHVTVVVPRAVAEAIARDLDSYDADREQP